MTTYFFILHERTFTKERANLLMPIKHESPACEHCPQDIVGNQIHRYAQCVKVNDAWQEVFSIIVSLDISMVFETDHSLIHLYFSESSREADILWVIGEYVDYVEKETVLKNRKISSTEILSYLKSRIHNCRNLPISYIRALLR